MSERATCEICGIESPLTELHYGWSGYTCLDTTDCRPPHCYTPRQRQVAGLDVAVLDNLEWDADQGEKTCMAAEVQPAVLRALIDAARREARVRDD